MSRKVLCAVAAGLVGLVGLAVGCGKSPDPAPSAEAVTVTPGKPVGKVGFGEQ